MGKRELLIIAAFVCVGALAYQLTAPAPREGERRFSLSALRDAFRPRGGGPRAQATVTHGGTMPASASLSEISISGASSVTVTGESRADIAWTLATSVTGPDDATARRAADQVALGSDEVGAVLALTVRAPRDIRQTSTLTLRVPAHLTVRIDSARQSSVSAVAAVRLDNTSGEMRVDHIAGAVSGTHRNGAIAIADAGAIALTLSGVTATLDRAHGETTVSLRNGACRAQDLAGPFTVDAANALVELTRPSGAVQITLSGGSASVVQPRGSVRIDARNAAASATLDRAVPLTAIAIGGGMRLALPHDTLPIVLEAVADPGTIVATDLGLAPDARDRGATLRHTFGNEAHVALRIDGGEIVITQTK